MLTLYQSNNWIIYKDAVTAEDMLPNYSQEKLIRTELSTLFGLLVRQEIDFVYPGGHHYLQRSAQESVAFILHTPEFRLGDIPGLADDGARQVLAERFVACGFLEVVG